MISVEMNLRRLAGALAGQALDDDETPFIEIAPDIEDSTRGALVLCLNNEANHLRELREAGDDRMGVSRSLLEIVAMNIQEIATEGHHQEPTHVRLLDVSRLLRMILGEDD